MRKVKITFNFKIDLNKLPVPDRFKLLIHKIVQEIEAKSAEGDYIFRGEPEHYEQVSSTLYRKHLKIKKQVIDPVDMDIGSKAVDTTDINIIQNNLLVKAMNHDLNDLTKSKKDKIQAKVQHWGGATNLIDFTFDYRIALFFACSSDYDSDGRIILQNKESVQDFIRIPKEPKHRVDAQKSVFILPPKGFIEIDPDLVVNVPKELKTTMMKWLLLYDPQISDETIYNDLHGFIKFEDRYLRAITRFHQACDYEKKAENTCDEEQKITLFKKAIKYYKALIEEMPNHSKAYFRCAKLHGMLGKLENAIYFAEEAVDWGINQIDQYESFGLLGKCFFDSGNFEEAIKKSSDSIRLNGDYAEGYAIRGDAHSCINKNELAIQDYEKAIKLNPNKHRYYANRGLIYLKEEKSDLAIGDCTKSLQLKPDNYYALINRGNAYLQKNEFRLAIKDFTVAIGLNSSKFPVFACRGYSYLKIDDCDKGLSDFYKTLELEPNYHIAHLYLGNVHARKGELGNAVYHYSKLTGIDHDLNASSYHLFVVPNGRMNILTKEQLKAEGCVCRAVVYLRMQKWKEARADILTPKKITGKTDWFKNAHGSIEDFEKKYGVKIPKDLVELIFSPS